MMNVRSAPLLFLLSAACVAAPRAEPAPDAASPPLAVLNHLYVVVDSATYQAIAESGFLREEFAGFEQRTTQAGDGSSWTGTYLYGQTTYFEFFPEGRQFGPAGTGGIAYGVDESGGLERISERLSALAGASVGSGLRTRMRGADTIPWFRMVWPGYADSTAVLTTWAMEYHPEYLRRWYPGLRPEEDGISRRHNRARDFAPERYLKDIVAVTVALEEREAGRLLRELAALGYRLGERGEARVAAGPELEFRVIAPTGARMGITELRFSLLRPKQDERVYRLGCSTLTFQDDRTATWSL